VRELKILKAKHEEELEQKRIGKLQLAMIFRMNAFKWED
jgi:hypothetical protein